MDTFIINKATSEHCDVLAKIGADTFYETFRPHNTDEDIQAYIAKTYNTKTVAQNLQDPSIHYYVCYLNHVCVGYIKLLHDVTYSGLTAPAIELEKIYVAKQYHGKNAGQLLMQQAINHTKNNHYNMLFLGVWQENERAVSFYKRNGFDTFATRTFNLGSRVCNDFMMRLEL